jgi:hypothetical protein
MEIRVYRNILVHFCVNTYVYTYLCRCTTLYLMINNKQVCALWLLWIHKVTMSDLLVWFLLPHKRNVIRKHKLDLLQPQQIQPLLIHNLSLILLFRFQQIPSSLLQNNSVILLVRFLSPLYLRLLNLPIFPSPHPSSELCLPWAVLEMFWGSNKAWQKQEICSICQSRKLCVCIYIYIRISHMGRNEARTRAQSTLIERKPPPRGGYLCGRYPFKSLE